MLSQQYFSSVKGTAAGSSEEWLGQENCCWVKSAGSSEVLLGQEKSD